jgi:hypothetical protein
VILEQQPADSLSDRGFFAHERAQVQEPAAAEQNRRDERHGDTRRRDDRELLSQHSLARGRLTHGHKRYTTRRPKDKRSTILIRMRF